MLSCSGDDAPKETTERSYSAHMKRYCPSPPAGSGNYIYDICISEETYHQLEELRMSTTPSNSCLLVTFTALDGSTEIDDYLIRVDRGVECLYAD